MPTFTLPAICRFVCRQFFYEELIYIHNNNSSTNNLSTNKMIYIATIPLPTICLLLTQPKSSFNYY
jgi:hypothetical protein